MKKFYFAILLLPLFSHAQSPVTNSAGYGEELPSPACLACPGADWNDPMKITIADGSVATTGLNSNGNCFQSTCFYSRYLYAHNFNFAIPIGATIDSIFVDIKRAALSANAIHDSIVQLEKSDSLIGANLQSSTIWPTTLTYESYGHNNPLWGTTWLPADINDPTYGVVLKILNLTASEAQAEVDHIQMTVYYSTTTGNFSVTSSPSAIEWINSPNEISMNIFTSASVNCSSKIYNSSGQEVNSFNYGQSLIGQNYFHCSTEYLADGIYFCVINVGGNSYSRKFIVTK